jgi:periplasmic protein TonB
MKTLTGILTLLVLFALPACAQQEEEKAIDESQYLETVEVTPSIVGGLEALRKSLVYPEEAVRDSVQGTVIIRVLVNEEGGVDHVAVEKGVHPKLDQAALDAARKVSFNPAKVGQKTVKTKMMLPVKFRLN